MTSFTSLKSWMLLALLFVAGQAAAQQVILSEDFSKCTSKDPDNPEPRWMMEWILIHSLRVGVV